VVTAFVTYIDIPGKLGQLAALDPSTSRYRFHEITSSADPMLGFAPHWQRRLCRTHMDAGFWYCLVAVDPETDAKVGHVWTTTESANGRLNGMLDVRLAPDEVYVWDLFIDPAHRNLVLSQEMGEALIRTFEARGKRWGLTHVRYDNAASVMWHHLFGFDAAQVVNFVQVGDRLLQKLPFGESPRFGPVSRRGRHSTLDPADPFGLSFVPSPDHQLDRAALRGLRRRGHEPS
jgi:GNAT superfamily N-acetyltransferase